MRGVLLEETQLNTGLRGKTTRKVLIYQILIEYHRFVEAAQHSDLEHPHRTELVFEGINSWSQSENPHAASSIEKGIQNK